ncbi:hypothetical protein NQ129_08040 [Priestia aryabhattai]|uniref:hypothetical protein n=1 Tax=Priestia aryabhattai TaxID=412384 RepID=UPI00211BCC07|nr:hypothetical protein [Priestia aryabhattai]MCQ9281724.1 hypothetical protein [Priestia aryabhattai]
MELTDKMVQAIAEIAETNAEIWDVFDICTKHDLNHAEESIVIAMYEQAKHEMKSIIDLQKQEDKEINEAMRYVNEPVEYEPMNLTENGFWCK